MRALSIAVLLMLLGAAPASAQCGAYLRAGVTVQRNSNFEGAVRHYTAALACGTRLLDPLYFRGSAYFALGRDREAIADFDRFIDLDERNYSKSEVLPWVYVFRGLAKLRGGQAQESLADFEEGLRWARRVQPATSKLVLPTLEAAFHLVGVRAAARYGGGLAKQRSGDAQGGAADIAEATRINPRVADAFAKLGFAR